ncbi:mitochondrial intermediate peptidase, mitochondrial isoform X2 [Magnolia sinica]|uniref:mitochondrial intermediate peptidase, mitochondrial isoform X2 n=1 Tax=Magnolia sinica TaxID=86752 RepID=UPI0026582741|nr:mitochondrial intermediate peptidase, mitochondrial isoform X2 [Magnolia sinica]
MSALIRRKAPIFHCKLSLYRKFTTRSVFDVSVSAENADNGLYGFEILKTAKGFRRFVDEAIERSGELISHISQLPPSIEIIRVMDEISDTVCSVVDSAELCRNTHPDREFVEEANKASLKIYEYLHFLNTNHDLYNAVIKAEREGLLQTKEAQRAAHTLRVDFEKGGIHLCAGKLERVNQLNIEIAQLGRDFSENIITDPGFVDIFPASRIPKHMQHLLKPIYRTMSGASKEPLGSRDMVKEKGFRVTTDPGTLSSILKWASDAEVRKQSYTSGNSVPRANLGVLDKLIAARHELAEIMGYKSYAQFAVHPNIASSPEVVMPFLLDLSKIVRHKADEEFKAIRDFKRKICNEDCADLEPWDEAYFMGMMKSSTFNLDSSVVASYFPLSQCIEGLKVLVKSLFGATFRNIPLGPGESWHPDVLKMSLHHPEEGDLGYLYLDLYSRKGKYPGCAHFAIKGGRRLSETEYQLPVVALVCNFSASPGSSTARLNHWEVETLFHEFGHALHSLLSRTDYQHFSGTRMVLDLAETPANLFEYYAWDYRVLRTFARHYSSGEVIPEKLVESMNGARRMFAVTELQRQIFFSLIDQTLFGEQSAPQRDTVSIVADLKQQYTSWNHVEGTHWHTRFNHLINYGAGDIHNPTMLSINHLHINDNLGLVSVGYYSYLYAKCFAATIWQEVCLEDPLCLNTGSVLRTEFLQHGGAKDPSHLLKDFMGDRVLRCCNGGIVPDASSLFIEMNL